MIDLGRLIDQEDLSLDEIVSAKCFRYKRTGCSGIVLRSSFHVFREFHASEDNDNLKDVLNTEEFNRYLSEGSYQTQILSGLIGALFEIGFENGIYEPGMKCDLWISNWESYRNMGTKTLFNIFMQIYSENKRG